MSLVQLQIFFLAAAPTRESTNSWFYIGWLVWSLLIGILVGGAIGYGRNTPRSLKLEHLERSIKGGILGACIAIPVLFILIVVLRLLVSSVLLLPDGLFITTGLAAGLPRRQTVVIFQAIFALIGGFVGSRIV